MPFESPRILQCPLERDREHFKPGAYKLTGSNSEITDLLMWKFISESGFSVMVIVISPGRSLAVFGSVSEYHHTLHKCKI
jgi:hypothetical protein